MFSRNEPEGQPPTKTCKTEEARAPAPSAAAAASSSHLNGGRPVLPLKDDGDNDDDDGGNDRADGDSNEDDE